MENKLFSWRITFTAILFFHVLSIIRKPRQEDGQSFEINLLEERNMSSLPETRVWNSSKLDGGDDDANAPW